MTRILYTIATAFLLLWVAGCESIVLDKQPLDIISDPVVWQDPALVDAFLADMYFDTDFLERRNNSTVNPQVALSTSMSMIASLGGEGRSYGGHHGPYQASTRPMTAAGVHSQLDYWKYDNIRDCNLLIEKLQTEAELDQSFIDQRIAEARFLRAYMYFQMVKRYGGIPLITEVQTLDTPLGELQVSRNSEKEVYDFIISEMDDLGQALPSTYDAADKGRPTKWAAYALQSRAAIYAASIAKYGQEQMSGMLGFPSGDVNGYAQKAISASETIMNNGIHALYEAHEDKALNFQNLFLDESDANTEVIMSEVYDFGLNRGHAYTARAMPHEYNNSFGVYYFLYDWIERFEYASGAPGDSISRETLASQEWDIQELYGNRDPRFTASVFYPEADWKGGKVYFHSGTMRDGELITSGFAEDGWQYKAQERNTTKTGFMVRKRTNPNVEPSGGFPGLKNDDTDYIIFRLGEIFLNLAEAHFYLDQTAQALDALNAVRERAGMPPKAEINDDILQNERLVELSWENQSYWDERRWRIAEALLDGVRMAGIKWIYNYETKKYQIEFINAEGVPRIFKSHYYYMPLGISRVADNPNMVENPGY
ncbi:MAG: RagB/SusD family nutrient uptake outer membrane protein [Bacteroidota bacterium]